MQHDVFSNPSRLSRSNFPPIAVMEQDFASSDERLCASLLRRQRGPISRGAPVVMLDGIDYSVILQQMRPFPARLLRRPIGSIAAYRDDIVRALDWSFTGI